MYFRFLDINLSCSMYFLILGLFFITRRQYKVLRTIVQLELIIVRLYLKYVTNAVSSVCFIYFLAFCFSCCTHFVSYPSWYTLDIVNQPHITIFTIIIVISINSDDFARVNTNSSYVLINFVFIAVLISWYWFHSLCHYYLCHIS